MRSSYALHGVYGAPAHSTTAPLVTTPSAAAPPLISSFPPPTSSNNTAGTIRKGRASILHGRCSREKERIPDDTTLLTVPDAELCSRYRVSLSVVWRWRAQVSRLRSPLFHSTTSTPADVNSSADSETVDRPSILKTAADLLHRHADKAADAVHSSSTTTERISAQQRESSAQPHVRDTAPLPTGLPTLDAALLGGLRRGWITELTGPPNSGKTTVAAAWCRHALLHAASPGVNALSSSHCVWLQSSSTIGAAVRGLAAQPRCLTSPSPLSSSSTTHRDDVRDALGDAVHVGCLTDVDGLQAQLHTWLNDPAALQHVGLVVVDSITELVRKSFTYRDDDALQRHDTLASLLQTLKRVAEEAQVAVLLVTQQQQHGPLSSPFQVFSPHLRINVTAGEVDDFDDDGGGFSGDMHRGSCGHFSFSRTDTKGDSGRRTIFRTEQTSTASPASPDVGELGRLFFHNVNVRLQVRDVRRDRVVAPTFDPRTLSFTEDRVVRVAQWQLEVLKCPLCAPMAIPLQVNMASREGDAEEEAGDSCATDMCAAPLDVVEGSCQGSAPQISMPSDMSNELLYASLDPWDFTDTPTFLYV